MFHAFLGEKLPDWAAAARLVRTIAENYKLPYYTLSPTYSICAEHGYLIGEHSVCPICGKRAEIYSRITGYYRPVQNWNEGKTQEYKNRTTYDITGSVLKKGNKGAETVKEAVHNAEIPAGSYLFTTKTCPNCKMAKQFLKDVDYEVVDAEENAELAEQLGIMQAPTLVVIKDGQVKKIANASNIRKYAETIA